MVASTIILTGRLLKYERSYKFLVVNMLLMPVILLCVCRVEDVIMQGVKTSAQEAHSHDHGHEHEHDHGHDHGHSHEHDHKNECKEDHVHTADCG